MEVIKIDPRKRSIEVEKLPKSDKYDNEWKKLVGVDSDEDSDGYLTPEFDFRHKSKGYVLWMNSEARSNNEDKMNSFRNKLCPEVQFFGTCFISGWHFSTTNIYSSKDILNYVKENFYFDSQI